MFSAFFKYYSYIESSRLVSVCVEIMETEMVSKQESCSIYILFPRFPLSMRLLGMHY